MGEPSELCIKASKKHGEDLRQLALRQKLLDLSRKPRAYKSHILLPIQRMPLEEEQVALKSITGFEIRRCILPRARPAPKSLADLLVGIIPLKQLGDLPKSYDIIGDIIVIEDLSKGLINHKEAIGDAVLKINPNAKTCLLKIGKVAGERRVPTYQVLSGLAKTETVYTEYGVRLKIDLAKVYFSPRLAFERQRVAASISDGDVVVDMFAGIGPFSLTIAKKVNATIYSIDINPDAIELLKTNISLNRLKGTISPICGDATTASQRMVGIADHVVMNLPGSSLKFLNAAVSMLKPRGGLLHIYTFSADPEVAHTGELVGEALKASCKLIDIRGLRVVKEVAPRKWQIAVDAACKGPVKSGIVKLPRQQQS